MPDALYRFLLLALPSDIRREFGADMAQMFRDHREANAGRPLRLAALWIAAVGDIAAQSVLERVPRRSPASLDDRPTSWSLFMSTFRSDLRHGARLLRRYPTTSLLAIATLALGIGANTAIFSIVDAVLLRQLPYGEPDRIVMVWEKRPAEDTMNNPVSQSDFVDWRRRQEPFDAIAAFATTTATLTGQGEPQRIGVGAVTTAFFDALGVAPARGRAFQPRDEILGTHRVVVITAGLWQRVFGGDPSAVGRRIDLNGNAFEIVGVLPASFAFPDPTLEIWAPMPLEGPGIATTRVLHNLRVYARLKAGVTLEKARDAMDRLGRQIEAEHPDENRGHGAWVTTLREEYVGPVEASLAMLFGAVGLVLLIACVNVASLLLTRAASRRREMAIRAALGAGRARLVTQSLAESLTLSMAGGAAGLGVAVLVLRALPLVLPDQVSVVDVATVSLDLRVLVFALMLTIGTGVLFGVLPALAVSRPDVADAVKEGGRGAAGVRRRVRRALVIGEVTLATLALVGGGLVLRSFMALVSEPLGFAGDHRLTATLSLSGPQYATPESRRLMLDTLERRMAALPGVTAAGGINLLPLGGGDSRTGIGFEGRERREGDPPTRMHPRIVTPGYFSAMGIPILRGRGFTDADAHAAEPVAIVSEASVKRFYADEEPIGRRIRFGGDEVWRRIVGVAGDVRHWGLAQPSNPMLYWPQAQANSSFLTFVLRTSGQPTAITGALRAAVSEVDPLLPVGDVRTLEDVVSRSVRSQRAQTILMGAFGVLGLALAVVGVYGVMGQLVAVRRHEIGVRMTLGARPIDILRQFLADGLWQTAVGIVLGLAGGAYLMTLAQSLLFGVTPWDLPTLAGVSVVLLAAGATACFIPARRAMRIDPVEAMRQS